MILIEDILKVHQILIEKYGGGIGVREFGSLESAIARPFQTFDGEDLYETIFEKAAALGESIIINHPFIDGNKRTGFVSMIALVEAAGYFLNASEEEAYAFTIKISTGEIRFEQIVEWLKQNTITI
jgi:death on curing protein